MITAIFEVGAAFLALCVLATFVLIAGLLIESRDQSTPERSTPLLPRSVERRGSIRCYRHHPHRKLYDWREEGWA